MSCSQAPIKKMTQTGSHLGLAPWAWSKIRCAFWHFEGNKPLTAWTGWRSEAWNYFDRTLHNRHTSCWVRFSCSVVSDSLRPHELQHTRPPCPSPTPRVYPNSCPLSQWCHPTISSSVIPFSSCLQSFPTSGSFQMSQTFTSGGQNTGVSASTSVLPMNTQGWSPSEWTSWISLQSKGLSGVFSNTTVQRH